MEQETIKNLINDKIIQKIMKKMNEISNAIEDLKIQKEIINKNVVDENESFEDLCIDNNNAKIFTSIIDIYSQRLSSLEDLMTEYWSIKLNKKKINPDIYNEFIMDVKKRINIALLPIEFNLTESSKENNKVKKNIRKH